MKESRKKNIFRVVSRNKDQVEEPQTPTVVHTPPPPPPLVPHGKKRSFLRRNTDSTPSTSSSKRNVLSNATNTVSVRMGDTLKEGSNPLQQQQLQQQSLNDNDQQWISNSNIANTTASTIAAEDMPTRDNLGSAGINPYDYKTFSDHPLRLSKIRALEQSEMTYRMFFQRFNDDLNNNSEGVSTCNNTGPWGKTTRWSMKWPHNNYGDHQNDYIEEEPVAEEPQIIVQIPNMSIEETKRITNPDIYGTSFKLSSRQQHDSSGRENVALDRKSNIVKRNAFKPMSKSELASTKLANSKLPFIFQNTNDFLKTLSFEELEFVQVLNESFEQEMKLLKQELTNETKKRRCLSSSNGAYTLIDAPFDQLYEPSPWKQSLGKVLSHDVRKHAKQVLAEDSLKGSFAEQSDGSADVSMIT